MATRANFHPYERLPSIQTKTERRQEAKAGVRVFKLEREKWEGSLRNDTRNHKSKNNRKYSPQIQSRKPRHSSRLLSQHLRQRPRRMLIPIEKRRILSHNSLERSKSNLSNLPSTLFNFSEQPFFQRRIQNSKRRERRR